MFKQKENNVSSQSINSFFSPSNANDELFLLHQEMSVTRDDPLLKRKFITSLILDFSKLEKVLTFKDITLYLTPKDILKIAAAKENCCKMLIKAEIYKDDLSTWKKINGIAEYDERRCFRDKTNSCANSRLVK